MRTRFSQIALATAIVTVVLFAVGGLVRGTGSGLGCSTWPQCFPGRLFPTGATHSLIEFSHRGLAFLVICLSAGLGILAWRHRREGSRLLWPSLLAFPLVLSQAVLGGIVVRTDLDPWWVTAHFVAALALIADTVYVAASANYDAGREGPTGAQAKGFARLTLWSAVLTGALLLVGTYIRARGPGVGLAFDDWPLMDGRLVPTLGGVTTPMFLHRVLALAAFLVSAWVMVRARTMSERSATFVTWSTLGVVLFVMQIGIGAANVLSRLQPWSIVLHVAFAVLIWACAILLASVARARARQVRDADPSSAAADETAADPLSVRDTITAYVRLTKPRIIVLLLITTVPAMILADRGMPSWWLIAATLFGGAIAAGSANAINMYLDRDIDELMGRTRQRPLPAHAVSPDHALRFGFVMGAVSYLFLAAAVNVLAATLALSAIAFYVFVYTMWLKRSTTQNIVIGGAAGAVPALVGWAAVTGSLAAPAWILFAIVFVWTPPHFWALAMRFSGDYAAAGVPMLPVVKGDDETRRQIFLYSLLLFATTLLLVPVAPMGPIYSVSAAVLGGVFVYRALRLWQHPEHDRSWALFKYSIVYLAALFGAVALDALVGA